MKNERVKAQAVHLRVWVVYSHGQSSELFCKYKHIVGQRVYMLHMLLLPFLPIVALIVQNSSNLHDMLEYRRESVSIGLKVDGTTALGTSWCPQIDEIYEEIIQSIITQFHPFPFNWALFFNYRGDSEDLQTKFSISRHVQYFNKIKKIHKIFSFV